MCRSWVTCICRVLAAPPTDRSSTPVSISRRLKDRVLFGGDYPLFSYERLGKDWRAEGYSEEILEKVFRKNAERFLADVATGA